MSLNTLGDICQALTIFLTLSAYLPQWATLIQTQSSDGIALSTWAIWAGSSFLSLSYACVQFMSNKAIYMLLISTIGNTLCLLVTIYLILKYRQNKRISPREGSGYPSSGFTLAGDQ